MGNKPWETGRTTLLKRVQLGEITPEEALDHLKQLAAHAISPKERVVYITHRDLETGQYQFELHIPTAVFETSIQMGASYFPPDVPLTAEDIVIAMKAGQTGIIAEVDDLNNNRQITVRIR